MVRDTGKERSNILERGKVYFFYRPKVKGAAAKGTEQTAAHGFEDVERLYMILQPEGKKKFRRVVIGAKRMPDIRNGGDRKNWGFVDEVAGSASAITRELKAETYGTKTRGQRVRPEARPAGEGVYRIVRHGDHTHLAYALELPKKEGEVQKSLNIEPQASYIISIKNPAKGQPRRAGLQREQKADFPQKLLSRFEGRRFFDADPPDFLNYEGCEILLIGATVNARRDLGLELKTEDEDEASAKVFKELKIDKKTSTKEPLLAGKWA